MEDQTSKKSNTGIIVAIVVILLLGVGYMVFGKKTTTQPVVPNTQTQPTTVGETGSVTGTTTNANAVEMKVTASEFSFTPSTLTLTAGQPVKLTLVNAGKMPHNFTIDEIPGAKTVTIPGGGTTSIEFTPTTAGTFKFYCAIGNHRAQGMEGTATVQ